MRFPMDWMLLHFLPMDWQEQAGAQGPVLELELELELGLPMD